MRMAEAAAGGESLIESLAEDVLSTHHHRQEDEPSVQLTQQTEAGQQLSSGEEQHLEVGQESQGTEPQHQGDQQQLLAEQQLPGVESQLIVEQQLPEAEKLTIEAEQQHVGPEHIVPVQAPGRHQQSFVEQQQTEAMQPMEVTEETDIQNLAVTGLQTNVHTSPAQELPTVDHNHDATHENLDASHEGTLSEPATATDPSASQILEHSVAETAANPQSEKRKLDDSGTEESNKRAKTGTGIATTPNCEVSSSSPEKTDLTTASPTPDAPAVDPSQAPTADITNNAEVEKHADACSENVGEEENKEGMNETASKLLASGISISLIKKKKEESKSDESENETEKSEQPKEKEEETNSNPLDVGPTISVTMINKNITKETNSESQTGKFTLSLKSQSELIDPKKNEKSHSANMLTNGVSDTISVSKIAKTPQNTTPGISKPHLNTKTTSVLGSPPMIGQQRAGPPMISQPHGGMPGLQARPNGTLRSGAPLASGTVSEQLSAVATGIAEYMRHGLEEVLRELSAQGSPEATIKGLQLELEKMQWRHNQEMSEVKASIDNMIKDMKINMTKESQRAIEEFKKQAEMERQKAILETKKKQWCAHCGKEAIFYCCWNTSYCDYPCQQAHWPTHMATCSQTNQDEEAQAAPEPVPEQKPAVVSSALLNSLSRQPNMGGLNSMNLANSGVGMAPSSMGFVMPGMGMGMRPGMGMRSPMGVSIRPGMPGQLTISRPYFM